MTQLSRESVVYTTPWTSANGAAWLATPTSYSRTRISVASVTRRRPGWPRTQSLVGIFLLQDPNPDWARLQSPLTLFAETRSSNSEGLPGEDINSLFFWSELDQFKLTVSVSAALDNPAAEHISQRPAEVNLATRNTFHQAEQWLHECLTTHKEGPDYLSKPRLPTRVIDVGCDSESIVRLFEPSSVTHDQYTAISYCWGTRRFTATTTANIEAHKTGIDTSTLPQTIRDAITVTRGLGFRYLWNDALCIIQDSLDDKCKVIGGMGEIYRNCTLTIAAVSAAGSYEGFLHPKPLLMADLPYRCPDGEIGTVRLLSQKNVDLWCETMFTRGWCLQEYLLSARLLLFTNTEVIWSCQCTPFQRPDTTHVSYSFELPTLPTSPVHRLPVNFFTPSNPPSAPPGTQFDTAHFMEWTSLVANYSRRRLTVAADRLPAISGIARYFAQAYMDEYFAGLWKRQFIEFLTWRRSSRVQPENFSRPASYLAPSWSWASIEGPIEFQFQNGPVLKPPKVPGAKLISCTVETVSEHAPLGEVKGGRVILEAQLIPVSASPILQKSGFEGGVVYWDEFYPSWELDDEMKQTCWCMLLGEAWASSPKSSEAISLVLVPVDGSQDVFRRIGLHRYLAKAAAKPWNGATKRRTITII
ncbi:uncharacterized protein BP5553_01025 [Venustampulla echinocandica]|uniref:Heterokaryon incompatibility domain-containing protein n=1 Tax=Venustampulla echinocandica TaxID=2656787 RepID=A0A370TZU3_9HELO|nr:uncharacterized protein BP5553_01025 [Venustampulla echinocandica]RDL41046.1 hypothetical protein BP5553_01025 [Venustampulla echinocandica]